MRILIEIVHPADVLFFLRPIRAFLARGDKVVVASREKDVACSLLDSFDIPHEPITRAGKGVSGLAGELVKRWWALLRLGLRFRPQVMLGFGGVAISHCGRVLGVPSVVFYDSENARLQTCLTRPFVTHLTVPEDYSGPTPSGRTARLPGTKDLSYFYPGAFEADRDRALAAGLVPDRANVLLRFVSWGANHDFGKQGWTLEQVERLIDALTPHAALHVSSEGPVLPVLAPYLWRGEPAEIHHFMAFCDAVAGESATMACEAVALGVPALYAGVDFPGYTQGLSRRGLLTLVEPEARDSLPEAIIALLSNRAEFDRNRRQWLSQCPDWADAVIKTADAHAREPW